MPNNQNKFRMTKAEPVGVNLSQQLQNHRKLHVPDFQRNYSWEKDAVEQLWLDVMETFRIWHPQANESRGRDNGEQYLLGSTVLIPDPVHNDIEQIIDGQQRFATFTMIFCIIRDFVIELYEDELKADLKSHEFSQLRTLVGNYKEKLDNNQNVVASNDPNYLKRSSWKLKLNDVDEELFVAIQTYRQPGISELKFVTHGEKKKQLNQIAPSKTQVKSQQLIKKAYYFLYDTIRDGLITDFDDGKTKEDVESTTIDEAHTEGENEVANNPESIGLEACFWDNIKCWKKDGNGQRALEAAISWDDTTNDWKRWPKDDEESKLVAKMDSMNAKQQKIDGSDKFANFDAFMDWKVEEYKLGHKSNGGSIKGVNYYKGLESKVEELITTKTKEVRKINFPTLLAILKHIVQNIYMINVQGQTIEDNQTVNLLGEEDAFQIFETINARGTQLSKSNMVKNLVLRTINENDFGQGSKDPDELKNVLDVNKARWEKIFNENVKDQDDDSFLSESLRSRFPYDAQIVDASGHKGKVTKNTIFAILKNKIKNADEAESYIDEILLDSKFCKMLNTPGEIGNTDSYPRGIERYAILGLHALGAKFIRIPILTAKRKWAPNLVNGPVDTTAEKYRSLVKFLVPFFFRYKTIRNAPVQKLENIVMTLCKEIDNDAEVDDLIKFLLQYNNDEDFEFQIEGALEQVDGDVAKYILYAINKKLAASAFADTEPIKDPGLTLEHVLPQDEKKKYWKETDFYKDYDIKSNRKRPHMWQLFLNNIGNLTILRGDVNTKISDYQYLIKRNHRKCGCPKQNDLKNDACTCGQNGDADGYLSSGLDINKETVLELDGIKLNEWTALTIEKREVMFTELAKEIWRLPRIVCSSLTCKGHNDTDKIKKIKEYCSGKYDDVKQKKCPLCSKKLELEYPPNW